MKFVAVAVVVLSCVGLSLSQKSSTKEFDQREQQIAARLFQMYSGNLTFAKLREEAFSGPPRVSKPSTCTIIPPSASVPTSVHRVRPGDVKVVAALGDSLTAGRGARNGILGMLADYRGSSWSIGGDHDDKNYKTLPNILKRYNPALYGASIGEWAWNKGLNVAVSGDKSRDLLEQADSLIHRLQSDPKVNFEEDWKVVTVFIGGNDLCQYCGDKAGLNVVEFQKNVQATLDKLHAALPRTFINMVQVMNIEIIHELAKGLFCEAVHLFVCNCVSNANAASLNDTIAEKNKFQQAMVDLVGSGRYDTLDDRTVVLQPFYKDTYMPRTADGGIDYSYFAADCFHYSEKGQEEAGEALWNNMVEPVGAKRLTWTQGEQTECPTETHPFLYTKKNSIATNPKMRVVGV